MTKAYSRISGTEAGPVHSCAAPAAPASAAGRVCSAVKVLLQPEPRSISSIVSSALGSASKCSAGVSHALGASTSSGPPSAAAPSPSGAAPVPAQSTRSGLDASEHAASRPPRSWKLKHPARSSAASARHDLWKVTCAASARHDLWKVTYMTYGK